MGNITLYGFDFSLYTGRVRSYFIKAGLSYSERATSSRHFWKNVLPACSGKMTLPTIETESGDVIRDGAAIIDHYEEKGGHQFSPVAPKQRLLSLLFDVVGAEGLLRPAMHYRWGFPEENHAFLHLHFAAVMPKRSDSDALAEAQMQKMRVACQSFGAVPETAHLVEALYLELLDKLNAHFRVYPYLFGGKPSIGDFGMIAPMYAHLGRDPKPLSLMQQRAPHVFRWVERMNRPEADAWEFESNDETYLVDDTIPDTLIEVIKQIAIDFVPETKAASLCVNEWLRDQPEHTEVPSGVGNGVGVSTFKVRDTTITAVVQPYRFFLLQRVHEFFDSLNATDKGEVEVMLRACNMHEVLNLRIDREIGRRHNLEVLL